MDKKTQLEHLKEQMQKDEKLPLRKTATQLVFGEGNPDTDIYFLGETPGYYEDQQGRPFVGAAGKLLDQLLESIGLKRSDVYISNIVRFRPPQNRDPEPSEIEAFRPFVNKEIQIIEPKIIVTLGRFSMNKFFPLEKISKIHGKPQTITWKDHSAIIIPMYHPAAALRNEGIMIQIKQDFKVITNCLKEIKKEKIILGFGE